MARHGMGTGETADGFTLMDERHVVVLHNLHHKCGAVEADFRCWSFPPL